MTSWSFHWKYPTYGKILLLLKRYAPREKNGDHMHICLDSSVIVTALRRQEKDHVVWKMSGNSYPMVMERAACGGVLS